MLRSFSRMVWESRTSALRMKNCGGCWTAFIATISVQQPGKKAGFRPTARAPPPGGRALRSGQPCKSSRNRYAETLWISRRSNAGVCGQTSQGAQFLEKKPIGAAKAQWPATNPQAYPRRKRADLVGDCPDNPSRGAQHQAWPPDISRANCARVMVGISSPVIREKSRGPMPRLFLQDLRR